MESHNVCSWVWFLSPFWLYSLPLGEHTIIYLFILQRQILKFLVFWLLWIVLQWTFLYILFVLYIICICIEYIPSLWGMFMLNFKKYFQTVFQTDTVLICLYPVVRVPVLNSLLDTCYFLTCYFSHSGGCAYFMHLFVFLFVVLRFELRASH
jgi:hypothetical protein